LKFIKRKISSIRGMLGLLRLKKERIQSLGSELEKRSAKSPNKTLLMFEERTLTYDQFNKLANRYAHMFQKMGFKKGDNLVLLMDNRPEYLAIHAGLSKIGAIPALINSNLKGEVLAYAINIADASGIILGAEHSNEYIKIEKNIKLKYPGHIFLEKEGKNSDTPKEMNDVEPLLKSSSDQNPKIAPPITSKDTLEYIYTSGTTGKPKATVLKHQKWLQIGYGTGGFIMNAISDDVQYCCLPLYHNSGINLAWGATIMTGGTLALRRKFSASSFWNDIRKYNASLFVYIGELCRYLYNQPPKNDDSDNPLRVITGNGMRGDYWVDFQKRFNIERIVEVYGATEGIGALMNKKGVPGMIGKLNVLWMRMGEVVAYDQENDAFIRDNDGFLKKCKVGEKGMFLAEINQLSPFPGYKNNKKATNSKIIHDAFKKGDSYFISGDIFKLHENSYVSFVDRLGDTFKWKGEVVATNEVADILNRFGGIEDSNVYGVEVKNTEGRCGMVSFTLLPDTEIDMKQLADYVIEKLPVYARPYFVRLRSEKNVTSTFKQVKTSLRKEGFDPSKIQDKLYFLNPDTKTYIILNNDEYKKIQNGDYRF